MQIDSRWLTSLWRWVIQFHFMMMLMPGRLTSIWANTGYHSLLTYCHSLPHWREAVFSDDRYYIAGDLITTIDYHSWPIDHYWPLRGRLTTVFRPNLCADLTILLISFFWPLHSFLTLVLNRWSPVWWCPVDLHCLWLSLISDISLTLREIHLKSDWPWPRHCILPFPHYIPGDTFSGRLYWPGTVGNIVVLIWLLIRLFSLHATFYYQYWWPFIDLFDSLSLLPVPLTLTPRYSFYDSLLFHDLGWFMTVHSMTPLWHSFRRKVHCDFVQCSHSLLTCYDGLTLRIKSLDDTLFILTDSGRPLSATIHWLIHSTHFDDIHVQTHDTTIGEWEVYIVTSGGLLFTISGSSPFWPRRHSLQEAILTSSGITYIHLSLESWDDLTQRRWVFCEAWCD